MTGSAPPSPATARCRRRSTTFVLRRLTPSATFRSSGSCAMGGGELSSTSPPPTSGRTICDRPARTGSWEQGTMSFLRRGDPGAPRAPRYLALSNAGHAPRDNECHYRRAIHRQRRDALARHQQEIAGEVVGLREVHGDVVVHAQLLERAHRDESQSLGAAIGRYRYQDRGVEAAL